MTERATHEHNRHSPDHPDLSLQRQPNQKAADLARAGCLRPHTAPLLRHAGRDGHPHLRRARSVWWLFAGARLQAPAAGLHSRGSGRHLPGHQSGERDVGPALSGVRAGRISQARKRAARRAAGRDRLPSRTGVTPVLAARTVGPAFSGRNRHAACRPVCADANSGKTAPC